MTHETEHSSNNRMKIINIFLASSEELAEERKELTVLAASLNHILKKQGVFIDINRWEFFDSSMSKKRKQDEYNEILKECDMCLVLWWNRFGKYTEEELNVAYGMINEATGDKPFKLLVYFKDAEGEMDPTMKKFRENFVQIYNGHFADKYRDIDALKNHFLLQFQIYYTDMQNSMTNNSDMFTLKEGGLYVCGVKEVDLTKLKSFSNNKEYAMLQKNIAKSRKYLSIMTPDDPAYKDEQTDLQEMLKRQSELEKDIYSAALDICRMSSEASSERMQKAITLLNEGNADGAMQILSLVRDEAEHSYARYKMASQICEEELKGFHIKLNELNLDVNTVKINRPDGWCDTITKLYETIVKISREVYSDDQFEFLKVLGRAGEDLCLCGNYKNALLIYQEALDITDSLGKAKEDYHAVTFNKAYILTKLGSIHEIFTNHADARQCYQVAFNLYNELYGEDSSQSINTILNFIGSWQQEGYYSKALEYYNEFLANSDLTDFKKARVYRSAGICCFEIRKYQEALVWGRKSLDIFKALANETDSTDKDSLDGLNNWIASVKEDIGNVYTHMGNYELARQNYNEALSITEKLFGKNHINTASIINLFGVLFRLEGQYEKALEYHYKALHLRETAFIENEWIAESHLDIGKVLFEQGRYYEALDHNKMALKIYDVIYKSDNVHRIRAYALIADTLRKIERYGEALEFLKKGLDIVIICPDRERSLPVWHASIASCNHKLGNLELSLEQLKKALELYRIHYGEEDPLTQNTIEMIEKITNEIKN